MSFKHINAFLYNENVTLGVVKHVALQGLLYLRLGVSFAGDVSLYSDTRMNDSLCTKDGLSGSVTTQDLTSANLRTLNLEKEKTTLM